MSNRQGVLSVFGRPTLPYRPISLSVLPRIKFLAPDAPLDVHLTKSVFSPKSPTCRSFEVGLARISSNGINNPATEEDTTTECRSGRTLITMFWPLALRILPQ